MLTVGDVIEWAGGAAAVFAGWCYSGWALAMGILAVFLLYQAQCLSGFELQLPRRMIHWRKPKLVNPNTCLHDWEVFPGKEEGSPNFVACKICGMDRQTGEKVL